jgi:GAF domain-containing protein
MWNFLAPPKQENLLKAQAERILNIALLIILIVAICGSILSLVLPIFTQPTYAIDWSFTGTALVMIIAVLLLKWLTTFGYIEPVSWALTSILFFALTINRVLHSDIRDAGIIGYMMIIILASLLLGMRGIATFAILSLIASFAIYRFQALGITATAQPDVPVISEWVIFALLTIASSALIGAGSTISNRMSKQVIEALEISQENESALRQANEELEETRASLSQRTNELEKRTRYLEAASVVAAHSTTYLNPQELLERIAHLISEQFGFYHTGIFLIDETNEWAVLMAASSPGGQKMISRGHRLLVGKQGIVGYVTGIGNPHIAQTIHEDQLHAYTTELPETRSEMALPLKARGEIIGAIDIQDKNENAFTEEDVAILQVLADQVALALSNANLYQQVRESYEKDQTIYGEVTRREWLQQRESTNIYKYSQGTVHTLKPEEAEIPSSADVRQVPIVVRGNVIGHIDIHRCDNPNLEPEEEELISTLSEQLGIAMESARLFHRSQKLALDERMVTEISTRIRETLDMDSILKTAVQEIQKSMNLPEVTVRLSSEALHDPENNNGDLV